MNKHPSYFFGAAAFAAVIASIAPSFGSAAPGEPRRIERLVQSHGTTSADVTKRAETERVTYLGVEVSAVPAVLAAQLQLPPDRGLAVDFVQPDSPAAHAGLQKHDVLTMLEDQILIDGRQFSVLVRGYKEGDEIAITRLRAGEEETVRAVLETREVPVTRLFDRADHDFNYSFSYPGNGYRTFRIPTAPLPPQAGAIRILRPNTNVIFTDDDGRTMELTVDGDEKTLKAHDAGGKLIFEGPVSTADHRKALPGDLREQLEKLESMQIQAPPVPAAPAAPAAPHAAPRPLPGSTDSVDTRPQTPGRVIASDRPFDRARLPFLYTPTVVAL